MERERPNPDKLLAQIKKEEKKREKGKLKIFFGAAPGVGKTYAMLVSAKQKLSEGLDIVAGVVETHGRKETQELLKGLEVIELRNVEYRGKKLKDFDIDEALRRKPLIILVDEIAHTNAPGSRHKKRWQDVFELLDAGISVYSTLNVQHLESLNDVISHITGITVRETIPDLVLDKAEEIELIDLPPEDLLQRLSDGKVYVPELVASARDNFFKKGNLLALRELALRRTAERVDFQIQSYREVERVKEVWHASERILVCVGPNPGSIRLIRAARRMAAGLRAEWIAAHVEAPSKVKPSAKDLRQLDEHLRLAESLGAETVTLSGQKASEEILNYARSRNITKIIIGKPTHPRWKDKIFGSILDEIVRGSGDIDVHVMSGDSAEPVAHQIVRDKRQRSQYHDWILSIATVGCCTCIGALMYPYFALADLVMIYLLGVVFTASRAGKGPSLLATLLSIAAFDFFFVSPRFTFVVASPNYFITFAVMFVVAFFISRLTLKIKEQGESARKREHRAAALYSLSRKLVQEQNLKNLTAIAARQFNDVLSCNAVILLPDDQGKLGAPITSPGSFALDVKELSAAQWTFDHRKRAGLGTDTLSGVKALYLPLVTASKNIGAIGVMPGSQDSFFDREQIQIIESFANQTALAIERALLAQEAQLALVKVETETLRNTLLSSVSHDLRTPLAAITGAATTLLQKDMTFKVTERHELIQTIYEEVEHLNQIIRNLLVMTRLDAGAITINKELQSLEEIVGAVLTRFSEKLKDRPIQTNLQSDLPLISFDPLLIEQVFINLLDNAIKYTPAGSCIEISAFVRESDIIVEIKDRGPGIEQGKEQKIFEKFVRASSAGSGIGLGLTICRAIINAHGGFIMAENRSSGGSTFRFMLPVGAQLPPLTETLEE